MARRAIHLLGFVLSAVSISAYSIALAIRAGAIPVEPREGMLIADPDFFATLLWIASITGFFCASIVATRTAWSFYSHGKLAPILDRKVT